jgi:hypothetical protein
MIRPLYPLLPVLLLAACVAPKAVVVEEAPAAKPKVAGTRPAEPAGDAAPAVAPPRTVQQGGMRVPDLAEKLPERKDMTPTAAPAGGGPTVIATPPPGP